MTLCYHLTRWWLMRRLRHAQEQVRRADALITALRNHNDNYVMAMAVRDEWKDETHALSTRLLRLNVLEAMRSLPRVAR